MCYTEEVIYIMNQLNNVSLGVTFSLFRISTQFVRVWTGFTFGSRRNLFTRTDSVHFSLNTYRNSVHTHILQSPPYTHHLSPSFRLKGACFVPRGFCLFFAVKERRSNIA